MEIIKKTEPPPKPWAHECKCLFCGTPLRLEENDLFMVDGHTPAPIPTFMCPTCTNDNALAPTARPIYTILRRLPRTKREWMKTRGLSDD